VSTSLISPVNVSSALPVIAPAASPATDPPPSPAAYVSTPAAGNFTLTLGMSAATAQLLGLIVLGLVLLLAATKLAGDQLTARRNQQKGNHAKARADTGEGAAKKKRFRLPHPGRLASLRRRRAASRPASQPAAQAAQEMGGTP
jgi:hypothetical protein